MLARYYTCFYSIFVSFAPLHLQISRLPPDVNKIILVKYALISRMTQFVCIDSCLTRLFFKTYSYPFIQEFAIQDLERGVVRYFRQVWRNSSNTIVRCLLVLDSRYLLVLVKRTFSHFTSGIDLSLAALYSIAQRQRQGHARHGLCRVRRHHGRQERGRALDGF